MLRSRMAGTLVAAMALLAAACGSDGEEATTPDDPSLEAEAPVTTQAESDDSSDASDVQDRCR